MTHDMGMIQLQRFTAQITSAEQEIERIETLLRENPNIDKYIRHDLIKELAELNEVLDQIKS